MDKNDYRAWAHRAADWGADYLDGLRDRPVRPAVNPGDVAAQIATAPPESAHSLDRIFEDFERIVPGAMTHWQHPRFMAYFPANAAPASMIAEHLATAMSAQCMLWQTGPAATEMEIVMVDWLRQAFGLPDGLKGTLHDTATTATICAVMTMRERALAWQGNTTGLAGGPQLRIYASAENHSSIDKAVRLSGIGQENLVKVPTGPNDGLRPEALAQAIADDRAAGHLPAGIIACAGGTSIGAFDPIQDVTQIAREQDLYCHVDAAWAGSALICPELRHRFEGIANADSIVVNPHKWLGAQLECSVQFVRDRAQLINAVGIRPGYLDTLDQEEVTNFNEWSIALGRRFRALKVWFLMRAYGLEGLRRRIRDHIVWTDRIAAEIAEMPGLEIVTQPNLALFSFAHRAGDQATETLLNRINADGRIYLTQTKVKGRFVIRLTIGQFDTQDDDVTVAASVIRALSADL